jgi:uncharacterized protein (DUF2141 family)
MQYFGNQITMNYSCGVPVQGSYYVVVFMDRNADGLMSVTSFGPPAEPYGLWPTSTTGPNPTTINQDVPSANITLNSGGM